MPYQAGRNLAKSWCTAGTSVYLRNAGDPHQPGRLRGGHPLDAGLPWTPTLERHPAEPARAGGCEAVAG
ncbi:hypothetical protein QJS66_16290 [Kocuria rhizophila]|nr:hypothetical protein QJS66_16290 [Kocuria rhizophila]